MRMGRLALAASLLLATSGWAQTSSQSPSSQLPPNQAPPRSDDDINSSSSKDSQIDIAPPRNDAKDHPNSGLPEMTEPSRNTDAASSDVNEVHPFNPYRATKDDEVGEYYLKLKDYKGALARFQDALDYKPNDAIANFRMAQCYEKMNDPVQAAVHYREYLRILPNGPFAKDARKALEKLPAAPSTTAQQ